MTYKITYADADSSSDGAYVTLNHSTAVQRQRYRYHAAASDICPCTELRTGTYSFDDIDYTVIRHAELTVWGHGVLFLTLRKTV